MEATLTRTDGGQISLAEVAFEAKPIMQEVWTIKPEFAFYGLVYGSPDHTTHDLHHIVSGVNFKGHGIIINTTFIFEQYPSKEFEFESIHENWKVTSCVIVTNVTEKLGGSSIIEFEGIRDPVKIEVVEAEINGIHRQNTSDG